MRKPIQLALLAAVILLGVATAVLFLKYRKTTADLADLKVAEETARSRYDQTLQAIAEIQDSLSAISLGDTTVKLLSGNLQTEQRMTGESGREVLDRIAALRESIVRSKQRIRQLESSMKVSGIKVASLQKMIGTLKQSVTEKEQLVAELTGRVDSLQTQVAGLATEVQQTQDTLRVREDTIEEKRRELATVYYIVGSKKDLAASGVVVAKGGVLGLGKTLEPSGQVDESKLTALDTDQEDVVRTQAAKVKVISAQPASSYELRLVGGWMELHILDPKQFRKIKHLVIVTA